MFNRAIEIDPEYARAYAGVADCCSMLYTYFDAREFNLRQADIASSKALELEPELAEAHVARGLAVSLSKKFEEAEAEFETAMRLDPKLFEAAYWFGRARLSEGRYEDAVKLFDRASSLRPEDYQAAGMLAQSYAAMGQIAEARVALSEAAAARASSRLELTPDDARACIFAAVTHATLREPELALEFAQRGLAIDPDDPMLLYNVACTYARMDKLDDALVVSGARRGQGIWPQGMDRARPGSDVQLRESPRFQAIAQAM